MPLIPRRVNNNPGAFEVLYLSESPLPGRVADPPRFDGAKDRKSNRTTADIVARVQLKEGGATRGSLFGAGPGA